MKVNDFVVRFANVNGSGSASANALFAMAIFRMGVPVAPKNIFPSNIQGLPTWFEVRVNEAGHLGRREGVDVMVALNPQSWEEDVAAIRTGGWLLYDSTFVRAAPRDDIHMLGIPLTRIVNARFEAPRDRQLFKNVAYIGALAAFLDIDFAVLEGMVSDQFRGKEKVIRANIEALTLGRDYAAAHFDCPLAVRVRRSDAVGDRIMIEGNAAAGLGCVFGGATVAAWYPITPSTSLAEAFEGYCNQLRVDEESGRRKFAIIQAEDELAAIGMAIGANWNGARAFTATSGPGISLMGEFLGLAYFAEVPVVLFNIQRGGPSTGMPTRTQQADILACAYASHGDTKHILLFPGDPGECFDFAMESFELADQLQTPVIVMSDLDIGMNQWLTPPLTIDEGRPLNRGKVLDADALDALPEFGRYLDVDGDGIGWRTYPGTHPDKGAFFTRGSSHNEYARYTEDGAVNARMMTRLLAKFETAKSLLPEPVRGPGVEGEPGVGAESQGEPGVDATMGLLWFGSSGAAVPEALEMLAARHVHLDTIRLRAFPFSAGVEAFIRTHERVFILEQNRDAQMRQLLVNECGIDPARLTPILNFDGFPITAKRITDLITAALGQDESSENIGDFAAE